jgi:hypothetical protein
VKIGKRRGPHQVDLTALAAGAEERMVHVVGEVGAVGEGLSGHLWTVDRDVRMADVDGRGSDGG